jgi:hypothetical protein
MGWAACSAADRVDAFGLRDGLLMVTSLVFGRRHVAKRFEQSAVIEPVHPCQCCELHGLERPPRSFPTDHFRFEEPDDRFRERFIVAVASTADRRLNAGVGQPLRVAHR